MGHGHDTLFLAQLSDHVYAFDIQEKALVMTRKRLIDKSPKDNVTLIHDSHEHILTHIRSFKGVVFNLGYLPGDNKAIKTTKKTTINALSFASSCLNSFRFTILVVCLSGHEGGLEERHVESFSPR